MPSELLDAYQLRLSHDESIAGDSPKRIAYCTFYGLVGYKHHGSGGLLLDTGFGNPQVRTLDNAFKRDVAFTHPRRDGGQGTGNVPGVEPDIISAFVDSHRRALAWRQFCRGHAKRRHLGSARDVEDIAEHGGCGR